MIDLGKSFNHSEITLLSNCKFTKARFSYVLITQKLHYSQTAAFNCEVLKSAF